MKCPRCGENTPDYWQLFQIVDKKPDGGTSTGNSIHDDRKRTPDGAVSYKFDWMICAADECGQVVVRSRRMYRVPPDQSAEEVTIIVPRRRHRTVEKIVQDTEPGMTRDYREAVSVLFDSPRLSALLSRRIVADLLAKYAKLTDYTLYDRIKKFRADPQYPSGLGDNLDSLREIGNWTAHTKTNKDDQAEVIEASAEEAEWSLDILDRLFNYFIVGPAKDAAMRHSINAKKAQIDKSNP
jgi:hypothetical protein